MFAIFSNKLPPLPVKREIPTSMIRTPVRNVPFRGNMFDQIKGTSCNSCGK